MVNQNVCSVLKCSIRSDRTICNNLQIKLLVVSLLLDTPVLHCPVYLADRSVDGIHRNCSDRSVLIPFLFSRNESAALGNCEGDFEFNRRFERANVQLRIEHLERRQSLGDILCSKLLFTANCDICYLRVYRLNHPL